MPIKIVKKSEVSNKTQTLTESDASKAATSPQKGGSTQTAHPPLIDRLSLVITFKDDQDALDVHSNIWAQFEDKQVFQNEYGKALVGYKRAVRITLDGVKDKHRPLLQYSYAKPYATKMRIDFVPVDLGSEGLEKLHAVLTSLLPGGWLYFLTYGTITRIDVAVDILGVRMDQFLFLPKQGATSRRWNKDGHLETFTHGKPKANQTVVNNRKKKRLNLGQHWDGPTAVRIERRLRTPGIKKLSELPSLANPFVDLKMVENFPGHPPSVDPKSWSMFRDSIEVRGLPAALQLVKSTQKTIYRKHLAAHPSPWWDPVAIWKKWPTMLVELGIATPKKWN